MAPAPVPHRSRPTRERRQRRLLARASAARGRPLTALAVAVLAAERFIAESAFYGFVGHRNVLLVIKWTRSSTGVWYIEVHEYIATIRVEPAEQLAML